MGSSGAGRHGLFGRGLLWGRLNGGGLFRNRLLRSGFLGLWLLKFSGGLRRARSDGRNASLGDGEGRQSLARDGRGRCFGHGYLRHLRASLLGCGLLRGGLFWCRLLRLHRHLRHLRGRLLRSGFLRGWFFRGGIVRLFWLAGLLGGRNLGRGLFRGWNLGRGLSGRWHLGRRLSHWHRRLQNRDRRRRRNDLLLNGRRRRARAIRHIRSTRGDSVDDGLRHGHDRRHIGHRADSRGHSDDLGDNLAHLAGAFGGSLGRARCDSGDACLRDGQGRETFTRRDSLGRRQRQTAQAVRRRKGSRMQQAVREPKRAQMQQTGSDTTGCSGISGGCS
ncbi:hypothetical protein HYQ46_003284 [Verticillium longisporum]|nr:hypothetical protein HYQ46_003284 [Verticillium longisporum]